jgi:LEA14-like dessication related protein
MVAIVVEVGRWRTVDGNSVEKEGRGKLAVLVEYTLEIMEGWIKTGQERGEERQVDVKVNSHFEYLSLTLRALRRREGRETRVE